MPLPLLFQLEKFLPSRVWPTQVSSLYKKQSKCAHRGSLLARAGGLSHAPVLSFQTSRRLGCLSSLPLWSVSFQVSLLFRS